MKKTMLGFAACALILSSCSQNEELIDNTKLNQEEINFAPYVNKTKASVTNLDAMQIDAYPGFKVFAVQHAATEQTDYFKLPKFMDNLNVKFSNSLWVHSGKYYWPETDALSFFAIAPDNEKVGKINQGPSITVPITIQDNVIDQIDILAASALDLTREKNTEGQVVFTFKHILSKIGFSAQVADNENLKFRINSLSYQFVSGVNKLGKLTYGPSHNNIIIEKVANSDKQSSLHGTASHNLSLPLISLNGGREHIIENQEAKPIHGLDSYFMIIPQDLSNSSFITLTIRYNIAVAGDAWGKDRTVSVTIPGMNYQMGKAYTHNLIFSGDTTGGDDLLEVTFGVTKVEDWVNSTTQPSDTNVPNPAPSN